MTLIITSGATTLALDLILQLMAYGLRLATLLKNQNKAISLTFHTFIKNTDIKRISSIAKRGTLPHQAKSL